MKFNPELESDFNRSTFHVVDGRGRTKVSDQLHEFFENHIALIEPTFDHWRLFKPTSFFTVWHVKPGGRIKAYETDVDRMVKDQETADEIARQSEILFNKRLRLERADFDVKVISAKRGERDSWQWFWKKDHSPYTGKENTDLLDI